MPVKERARAVENPGPARRPARAPAPLRQPTVPQEPRHALSPAPVIPAQATASPLTYPNAGQRTQVAPQSPPLPLATHSETNGQEPVRRRQRAGASAPAPAPAQGNARVARRMRTREQDLATGHPASQPGPASSAAPLATPAERAVAARGVGAPTRPAAAGAAAATAPTAEHPLLVAPAPATAPGGPAQAATGAPAHPATVAAPAPATTPAAAALAAAAPAPATALTAPVQASAAGAVGAVGTEASSSAAAGRAARRDETAIARRPSAPDIRVSGAEERPVAAAGAPTAGAATGRRHPRSPYDDPGFRATVARVNTVAAGQRRHVSAHGAAAAAQAAAPGPAGEVRAGAEAQQVARIDEQHPKEFDKADFAELLRSRIDAKAPRNPQEARDFPSSGKLGELKTEMTGAAKTSAADAGADVRDQTQAAPDQSGIAPKPVTPLPETDTAPPPGDLGAAQAAPKPMPATDVSAGVNAQQQRLNDTMTQARVTDDQLATANEPTFTKALADKQAAGQKAATVPTQYRAAETTTIAAAQSQAVAVTQEQTTAMHSQRAALLQQVTGRQHVTMAADQASRAKVAGDLEQIYQKTRQAVQDRLDKLDKDVGTAFDAALTDARQAFEDYVETALDERYMNPLVWIDDKLLTWGLPPAVKAIFEAGRAKFIESMDAAIDHVSELVADGLNEAKQLSADGRKEVSEAVGRLDPALREVGREAAQNIGAKFDGLDQTIGAKRDQLVDTLAAKYQDGLKQLDDRITELESEHASLISKAVSSVTGVISTILEMKNLLMKVLAKALDTIEVIIAHPIRFLGNLVDAVGQGIRNFVSNILTHLKQGFFEWLFGEVAKAGITLPKTWDLKGIFDLVLQILGLTWPAVRKIAVEVVGEPIVRTLEVAAEPIIAFVREGPAGVWNWIKEQLSNLKAMVVDQIQSWVITNVIKAGITWLIGLLNPASAFIKACKAIYDILEFIWTRGKQILELVSAVVDSIAEIAAGSLGKAAQKVEDALAKAIPVTIGFLAGLLGIGDISETIKGIIEKIQAPVHAAVKWLITKAVALIKAAGKLLGFGKDDKEKGPHSDDPEKQAKIAKALAELDERDAKADTGEGIDRDEAETIAATTHANHPVLTSITVLETPQRYDYMWTASKASVHPAKVNKKKKKKLSPAAKAWKAQPAGASPAAYSVAFEMKLSNKDLGRSRSVHFNRANAALDAAMKADPEYAAQMEKMIPGVQESVSSVGGRETPAGAVWHHVPSKAAGRRIGVMHLVPEWQHEPGSDWWDVLHTKGGGGYSEWAIPRGAPAN